MFVSRYRSWQTGDVRSSHKGLPTDTFLGRQPAGSATQKNIAPAAPIPEAAFPETFAFFLGKGARLQELS